MGTWVRRLSWRGVPRRSDANRTTGDCLRLTVLSAMFLALLLITGVIEQNSGPIVEGENTVRILYTVCGRNLKSGIQCELCGRWYHYNCGSVRAQAAERENCNCDKCRTEEVRMLQGDMQNALRQIDELNARNRMPEERLLLAGSGKRDTVPAK